MGRDESKQPICEICKKPLPKDESSFAPACTKCVRKLRKELVRGTKKKTHPKEFN